jgi:hypothetical protein
MGTINFNQPSEGTVDSNNDALAITNNGSGGGIKSIVSNPAQKPAVYAQCWGVANALEAFQENADPNAPDPSAAVYGRSQNGIGVLGQTFVGIGAGAFNPRYAAIVGRGKKAGRFEGDVEVTGDIRLINADCAEEFDIQSNIAEPGTVMVLNKEGSLEQSHQAYDKKVAGVVSGAGDYKPAIVLDKKDDMADNINKRIPIALLGKVYCKADATHSPIDTGDLLTTSTKRSCHESR